MKKSSLTRSFLTLVLIGIVMAAKTKLSFDLSNNDRVWYPISSIFKDCSKYSWISVSNPNLSIYSPYDIIKYPLGGDYKDNKCVNWRAYKQIDGSIIAIAECGIGNFFLSKIDIEKNKISLMEIINRPNNNKIMFSYFP